MLSTYCPLHVAREPGLLAHMCDGSTQRRVYGRIWSVRPRTWNCRLLRSGLKTQRKKKKGKVAKDLNLSFKNNFSFIFIHKRVISLCVSVHHTCVVILEARRGRQIPQDKSVCEAPQGCWESDWTQGLGKATNALKH